MNGDRSLIYFYFFMYVHTGGKKYIAMNKNIFDFLFRLEDLMFYIYAVIKLIFVLFRKRYVLL